MPRSIEVKIAPAPLQRPAATLSHYLTITEKFTKGESSKHECLSRFRNNYWNEDKKNFSELKVDSIEKVSHEEYKQFFMDFHRLGPKGRCFIGDEEFNWQDKTHENQRKFILLLRNKLGWDDNAIYNLLSKHTQNKGLPLTAINHYTDFTDEKRPKAEEGPPPSTSQTNVVWHFYNGNNLPLFSTQEELHTRPCNEKEISLIPGLALTQYRCDTSVLHSIQVSNTLIEDIFLGRYGTARITEEKIATVRREDYENAYSRLKELSNPVYKQTITDILKEIDNIAWKQQPNPNYPLLTCVLNQSYNAIVYNTGKDRQLLHHTARLFNQRSCYRYYQGLKSLLFGLVELATSVALFPILCSLSLSTMILTGTKVTWNQMLNAVSCVGSAVSTLVDGYRFFSKGNLCNSMITLQTQLPTNRVR